MSTQTGDANFSEDFRNPNKREAGYPNEATSIADKFYLIAQQRERIMESFLAEHNGMKPSEVAQVVTTLPSGDIQWHLERVK